MTEPANDIRYLSREEIDTDKWDNCIIHSVNGLIYARSFYLDAMAKNWAALVMNDYEMVMPLPWKRKYGISYLYQPAFTPQLGIFATHSLLSVLPGSPAALAPSLVDAFLVALGRHFRFAEIFLNYGNPHSLLKPHTNFILPLNSPYEELFSRYKKDLLKNLKATARSTLHYTRDLDLREALALHRALYQNRMQHLKDEIYTRFESLCLFLQQQGQILLRAVMGPGEEILASALLPRDKGRLYLLQSSTTTAGRSVEANHFLLDNLIREFAGQPLILDFEGSELPGIAHFYANFGAENQPSFFYRHNQLPWPLRMIK